MTLAGLSHLLDELAMPGCVTFTGDESPDYVLAQIEIAAPGRIVVSLSPVSRVLFSQLKWLARVMMFCVQPQVLLLSRLPIYWLPASLQNMSCSMLVEWRFRRIPSCSSLDNLRSILSEWEAGSELGNVPPLLCPERGLSPREVQIIQLSLEGVDMVRIARMLGISVKTVYVHRASALEKLDARTAEGSAVYRLWCLTWLLKIGFDDV
jgi:DNA-binding CsgD family transcriptional regulator